jgi:hypothetical protein
MIRRVIRKTVGAHDGAHVRDGDISAVAPPGTLFQEVVPGSSSWGHDGGEIIDVDYTVYVDDLAESAEG